MLGWLARNPVMVKYSRSSYQTLLDGITSDVRLQTALSACWFDYMLPPEKASITYAIGTWAHYLDGAYYPRGGSGALRDAFVEALEESGTKLKEAARVVAIGRQGGEFVVRTVDGEQCTSKVVVSNVDPIVTLGDLANPELVPSRIAKKAKGLRPSASVFAVFIGTDLDLPSLGMTSGNLVHCAGYDINVVFEETMNIVSPQVSSCIFINSPSVRDPDGKLAPKGHHSLEILAGSSYAAFEEWENLPPGDRGEAYGSFERELGDQLISTAEHYIPGLSQHLVSVEYFTPLSLRDQTNLVRGGIYGAELSPDQLGPGRFPDGTCGIEGFYLAGAGALGGNVRSCLESGIQAGTRAIEYLGS
jgi:phytoene dehydrogenase-like protein